ncbi:tetratricopeptide repeat protein [Micromonospora sp. NPDC020750]|uniref:tetratricopeptide repeat protein n=1 Tax=unclassified Micromonospora TaxID=2617518 RepID=UPI0037B05145
MSSAFGDLTVQAHHLVSAGDLAGAQQLLSDALSDADPRPDHASPELADAAGLQARVLVALGEPHSARGWAAFTYAATSRLYSPSDPRTVSAAATLAAVLHRVGSYARAARLYSDVIIELTASDGPESLRVLAAHADLATVEYARGQCEVARERLQDAWELHREVYGDGHPSGIKMLARLGAMQRDCGKFAEAHDHLALARELCRQHLAVDDPLAVQVAGLARAAANPDHVCARTSPADREEPAEAPVVPAARVPPAAEGPPMYQTAWPPEDDPYPPAVPAPRTPPDGVADHAPAYPGGDDPWVRQHAAPGAPARAGDDDRRARDGDEQGARPYPEDDGRWPDEPGWPADSSLPPTVVGLAGAGDEPAGVRAVHPPVTREDRSRLLPVLVPRPPAPPSRRLTPLVVLGGVTVMVLGTAAVIAGVARVDRPAPGPVPSVTAPSGSGAPGVGPSGVGPSGGASASPRAAASPGTPPGGFTVRDNRDNIALRWTYPAGATGPVVLAKGQSGQEPRAFETLPPGSTSLLVYGLDRADDYCFTVAVVWSVETVGRSSQVCTNRR